VDVDNLQCDLDFCHIRVRRLSIPGAIIEMKRDDGRHRRPASEREDLAAAKPCRAVSSGFRECSGRPAEIEIRFLHDCRPDEESSWLEHGRFVRKEFDKFVPVEIVECVDELSEGLPHLSLVDCQPRRRWRL